MAEARAVKPYRLASFTFGIQVIWGAILGVSLQSRADALAGANAVTVFSYVLAIGAAIATVTQVVVGIAADARSARVGHRREFYLWGVAAAVPALVWFYLAPTLIQFALAFFLLQLAVNAASGPYQAAIPDYVPPQRRGEASSWMSGWQSFGNVIGLVVVTFVADLRAVAAIFVALLLASWTTMYTHVRTLVTQPFTRAPLAIDNTFVTLLVSRGAINLGFFTLVDYLLFYVEQSLGVRGGADAVRTQTGLIFLTFTMTAIAGAALAAIAAYGTYRYLPHQLVPEGALHSPIEAIETVAELGIAGVPPITADEDDRTLAPR